MRPHRTYAYATVSKPHRRAPTLDELFITPEAAQLAKDLVAEMKADQKTLYECMRRLVLAGATGYKMDVVKDMAGKFPRYGSFTAAQQSFALSIVSEHHMPRLMEILAAEAEGDDIMADAPAIVEADRVRREAAAQARHDARMLEDFGSAGVTEANPTYGMF